MAAPLWPPNAISGAAGLILAPSPFAGGGGLPIPTPHQDWLINLLRVFSDPNLLALLTTKLFSERISMATSSCLPQNKRVLSAFFPTAPMFC